MRIGRLEVIATGTLIVVLLGALGGWIYWVRLEADFTDAVIRGDAGRVQRLLARGINVNTRDYFGKRPLAYAAVDHHVEVARLLLDAGANVNEVDPEDGSTPLTRALIWAPLRPGGALATTRLLLERGANPDHRPASGRSARDWARKWAGSLAAQPDPYQKVGRSALPGVEIGVRSRKELVADLRALVALLQSAGHPKQ